ncbi:prepilin peptidase [Tateyamaria sp. SN6-1]|uniref:prepilin peptidase n=1 Tax=Tateyamaria sp. SN6-1 TaxID=3092148 RepID=UPI0039F62475
MVSAIAFFVLALGPCVGSFIAVLVDRMPMGQDVLTTPSRCQRCATPLRAWQMVPILSFALLRGRCAQCAAPIPPHLLYLELLGIGAAVLAVAAGGPVLLTALMLWVLLALAACDLAMFRLPDPLTALLFVTVLARSNMPVTALWGAAIGVTAFLAIRWLYARLRGREGLGLGDVKLMAGLGALAGPALLPHLVLVAACLALAVALIRGQLHGQTPLPFGTALCAAATALLIWFSL